jgi:hypothetical protein
VLGVLALLALVALVVLLGRRRRLRNPLRVTQLWGKTVVDERTYENSVVVGHGPGADFATPDVGLPSLYTLFRRGFRSDGLMMGLGCVSGRVVYEKDTRIIWVGYAVGGVFKSVNAGTTFLPVFEKYGSASIGDIAVDQTNPNVVWVGTVTEQSTDFIVRRRHLQDHGRRQDLHEHGSPRDADDCAHRHRSKHPDVVYVASPGHLFGRNAERGIFKTTDGGRRGTRSSTSTRIPGLQISQSISSNPNVLYTAATSVVARDAASTAVGGQRALEDRRRRAHVDGNSPPGLPAVHSAENRVDVALDLNVPLRAGRGMKERCAPNAAAANTEVRRQGWPRRI